MREQSNDRGAGKACRTQWQARDPPQAHTFSVTHMLNCGRGQQSWLDSSTLRRHAVPSLPTWMGIPGTFPNGSSPHKKPATLNLNNVAADAHGSKCNVNLSLLSLWEPRAGPQFQLGDGRDCSLILFRFTRNAFVGDFIDASTCSKAGCAKSQPPPGVGQRAQSCQQLGVPRAEPNGRKCSQVSGRWSSGATGKALKLSV